MFLISFFFFQMHEAIPIAQKDTEQKGISLFCPTQSHFPGVTTINSFWYIFPEVAYAHEYIFSYWTLCPATCFFHTVEHIKTILSHFFEDMPQLNTRKEAGKLLQQGHMEGIFTN